MNEKVVTPPHRLSPRHSGLEDRKLGLADDLTVGDPGIDRVT